jgi:hypothetical protein
MQLARCVGEVDNSSLVEAWWKPASLLSNTEHMFYAHMAVKESRCGTYLRTNIWFLRTL